MGKAEYEAILEYELGIAPWTEEVERAYMRMMASFTFGEESLENVPLDWWEEHRKDFMQ